MVTNLGVVDRSDCISSSEGAAKLIHEHKLAHVEQYSAEILEAVLLGVGRELGSLATGRRPAGNQTQREVDAVGAGRPPTDRERAEFSAYAEKHGFENLCRVLFNVSEFVFVD